MTTEDLARAISAEATRRDLEGVILDRARPHFRWWFWRGVRTGLGALLLFEWALMLAWIALTDTGHRVFWAVAIRAYEHLAELGTVLTVGSP